MTAGVDVGLVLSMLAHVVDLAERIVDAVSDDDLDHANAEAVAVRVGIAAQRLQQRVDAARARLSVE